MHINETPSWPKAKAAQDAWNKIRKTNASEADKAKVRDEYRRCASQCVRELGTMSASKTNLSVRAPQR